MELYAFDEERNAQSFRERDRDRRDRGTDRGTGVLRSVRPVVVSRDRQPAAAQPVAAPQPAVYAQPAMYPQPMGYPPQNFASAGYMPSAPDYSAWGGRPWGMPYAGPGPWGPQPMGPVGQSLVSGLGSLVELGTSLFAAFQSLPIAPTAAESADPANLTDYQRRLAEHAKGDERLRTIGSAGGRVVDLAVRLFSNSGQYGAAPRWY